jgi:hypothetical protein
MPLVLDAMGSAGDAYARFTGYDAYQDLAWAAHVYTLADPELGVFPDHAELA